MSEVLTIESITNYYLFNQKNRPSDLNSEDYIRPENDRGQVSVDVVEFMSTGAGRFALGAKFDLVARFFDSSFSIPPGEYTKADIAAMFGMTSYRLTLQQYGLDDGEDDYDERVYIWNETAFQIADEARFVVGADGTRLIENFSVIPLGDENFDYEGSNPVINFFQSFLLEEKVDPSAIGRTVDIAFDGVVPGRTYTVADYVADIYTIMSWNPLAIAKLFQLTGVPEGLYESGAINYEYEGLAVRWLTDDSDVAPAAHASDFEEHALIGDLAKAGQIVFMGDGVDEFVLDWGDTYAEFRLYGGDGEDFVESQAEDGDYWTIKLNDIEAFAGSDFDDYLLVESGSNTLVMDMYDGHDWVEVQAEGLEIEFDGGAGDDYIVLSNGGGGTIEGGSGDDTVSFAHSDTAISVHLGSGPFSSGAYNIAGFETIIGSAFDDTIESDSAHVMGGLGNDIIRAHGDNQYVWGDFGDDEIHVVDGNVNVFGGEGYDRLFVDGYNSPHDYLDFEEWTFTHPDDVFTYDSTVEGSAFMRDGDDLVYMPTAKNGAEPGQFYFDGGSGVDKIVFETWTQTSSQSNGPWYAYVVGFEELVDQYKGENLSWVCGVGEYTYSGSPGNEYHSWHYWDGFKYWGLSLNTYDVDLSDDVFQASISYSYIEDVRLEENAEGYSINVWAQDMSWGDFGFAAMQVPSAPQSQVADQAHLPHRLQHTDWAPTENSWSTDWLDWSDKPYRQFQPELIASDWLI